MAGRLNNTDTDAIIINLINESALSYIDKREMIETYDQVYKNTGSQEQLINLFLVMIDQALARAGPPSRYLRENQTFASMGNALQHRQMLGRRMNVTAFEPDAEKKAKDVATSRVQAKLEANEAKANKEAIEAKLKADIASRRVEIATRKAEETAKAAKEAEMKRKDTERLAAREAAKVKAQLEEPAAPAAPVPRPRPRVPRPEKPAAPAAPVLRPIPRPRIPNPAPPNNDNLPPNNDNQPPPDFPGGYLSKKQRKNKSKKNKSNKHKSRKNKSRKTKKH